MRRPRKLSLDPAQSAAVAGLKYVRDQTPGITRIRKGKGFLYVDTGGTRLSDKGQINRIRSLVIPPAWKKVWICAEASGHLQAVGYDARGRKQYRYHPEYRAIRNQTKDERLAEVAAALVNARKRVREHLALDGMPREKVLAAVIRLLDITGIRIGNQESAAEFKNFGLTTLRNQHVAIEGATLRFRFTGKSGIKHDVEITDRRLARIVRQCHDLPGQQLFEYIDESGEPRGISSTDVNAYLREVSGQSLTEKDFRTWVGTVECAVALRDIGEFTSLTEGRKNIVEAIKTAAQRLGNRAATCRAYYVHPAVTDAYLSGDLLPLMKSSGSDKTDAGLLSAEERAVLKALESHGSRVEALRMSA